MNDLEPRLRDAGARLRDTAPTPQATDAALAALGDVALDDLDTPPQPPLDHRPAVLATAAAIIGVVVVTRPDEAAIVPADTTTVRVDRAAVAGADDRAADDRRRQRRPRHRPRLPAGGDDGGDRPRVRGRLDDLGRRLRRRGRRLPDAVHRDGQRVGLRRRGDDGLGVRPAALAAPRRHAVLVLPPRRRRRRRARAARRRHGRERVLRRRGAPGALVENPACDGDGVGVLGVLPAAPDGAVTWTVTGVRGRRPARAARCGARARGARVPCVRPDATETCVVVVARNNSMREACSIPGRNVYAAGTSGAPLIVNADTAAGVATVEPLDPARCCAPTTAATSRRGSWSPSCPSTAWPAHSSAAPTSVRST